MASIPRVASNALLAALGIVVDALIVVETLPSETVEDRHTLSPAEAMRTSSRPLPTPLDPDTATRTCPKIAVFQDLSLCGLELLNGRSKGLGYRLKRKVLVRRCAFSPFRSKTPHRKWSNWPR